MRIVFLEDICINADDVSCVARGTSLAGLYKTTIYFKFGAPTLMINMPYDQAVAAIFPDELEEQPAKPSSPYFVIHLDLHEAFINTGADVAGHLKGIASQIVLSSEFVWDKFSIVLDDGVNCGYYGYTTGKEPK